MWTEKFREILTDQSPFGNLIISFAYCSKLEGARGRIARIMGKDDLRAITASEMR